MGTLLNEYGSLAVAILAVCAMFLVYGLILDRGMIQFTFYNASPLASYDERLDAEVVEVGSYTFGAAGDALFDIHNFGRNQENTAPWFSVGSNSETVIPVIDEDKARVEVDSAWIKEQFIDNYDISVKNYDSGYSLDLDDLLIVEYRPALITAFAHYKGTFSLP